MLPHDFPGRCSMQKNHVALFLRCKTLIDLLKSNVWCLDSCVRGNNPKIMLNTNLKKNPP